MDRYSRLLSLSSFSNEKLKILKSKEVLIIGVGGSGQHVATYLATNGIEHLTIVDFDVVDISNLNRQILLEEKDIGKSKVDIVKERLLSKNRNVMVDAINLRVDEESISELKIEKYDIVIDALDNWKSKLILSEECKKKNTILLHIGVDGDSGQFAVLKNNSLKDIFGEEIDSSPKDGVMGPTVGVIASMACSYLIKFLLGEEKENILISYNDKTHEITKISL